MEITFLGTGVAIPQRGRVQSGVLVRLEEKPLLIDCGSGVLSRFPEAEISHTEVDTVLLSHLHLDHVADLLCLLKANWLRGKTDMRVYGPEGTEDWFSRVLGAYEYIRMKLMWMLLSSFLEKNLLLKASTAKSPVRPQYTAFLPWLTA